MNILFLCVANSARSQMAEGLAKSMLGQGHNIQSAGSIPSGEVHPNAVIAMDEIGIDIRDQFSKSTDDLDKDFIDNLYTIIHVKLMSNTDQMKQRVKLIGARKSLINRDS